MTRQLSVVTALVGVLFPTIFNASNIFVTKGFVPSSSFTSSSTLVSVPIDSPSSSKNPNNSNQIRHKCRVKKKGAQLASSSQYFDDSPFYAEASFVMKTSSSSSERSRENSNEKYPSNVFVQIKRLSSIDDSHNDKQRNDNIITDMNTAINHPRDVTSARGWMEHIQQCEGSFYGVGAYTVLRCDIIYPFGEYEKKSSESESRLQMFQWMVWGKEFHLNRLLSSYELLVSSRLDEGEDIVDVPSAVAQEAKDETFTLMNKLLNEAKRSFLDNSSPSTFTKQDQSLSNSNQQKLVRTLMMTVLWTPPKADHTTGNDGIGKPIIRCHAAFAGSSRPFHVQNEEFSLAPPISTCLAIPNTPGFEELAKLPKRHSPSCTDFPYQNIGASAKVSSWCHDRRPLEDTERYKPAECGVGEVLLLRQGKEILRDDGAARRNKKSAVHDFIGSLEILEGLTSNLFVVYKDKTVRTAPTGSVLSGYARHLVIEELRVAGDDSKTLPDSNCADIMKGLVLDDVNPPNITDALRGLWSEVFVTSAIRLVTPVNRVLIPPIDGWNLDDGHESLCGNQSILWDAESHGHGVGLVARALRSAICKREYNKAKL
mmetsp:Transcript_26792/g.54152  ORF Transcript_26792/g.54152 Transcript_26792/m.54152 type:complete len:598 (+) Transcript_26792:282-2075(+)